MGGERGDLENCRALAKLRVPDPEVTIQINLAPANVVKEGSWLDLPMAIVMLQAAGILPALPEHVKGDFILMGEVDLHGEVRRVPVLSPLPTSPSPVSH